MEMLTPVSLETNGPPNDPSPNPLSPPIRVDDSNGVTPPSRLTPPVLAKQSPDAALPNDGKTGDAAIAANGQDFTHVLQTLLKGLLPPTSTGIEPMPVAPPRPSPAHEHRPTANNNNTINPFHNLLESLGQFMQGSGQACPPPGAKWPTHNGSGTMDPSESPQLVAAAAALLAPNQMPLSNAHKEAPMIPSPLANQNAAAYSNPAALMFQHMMLSQSTANQMPPPPPSSMNFPSNQSFQQQQPRPPQLPSNFDRGMLFHLGQQLIAMAAASNGNQVDNSQHMTPQSHATFLPNSPQANPLGLLPNAFFQQQSAPGAQTSTANGVVNAGGDMGKPVTQPNKPVVFGPGTPGMNGISMRGNQKYSAYYQHQRKQHNASTSAADTSMLRRQTANSVTTSSRGSYTTNSATGRRNRGNFESSDGSRAGHPPMTSSSKSAAVTSVGLHRSSTAQHKSTDHGNALSLNNASPTLDTANLPPTRHRDTAFLCCCGLDFENLYDFTSHMSDTGHRPKPDHSERDIPKLVRGQDMWINSETEQTREILRCMRCHQSFRSLPELTLHMMKTNHYSEMLCNNDPVSGRPMYDADHKARSHASTGAVPGSKRTYRQAGWFNGSKPSASVAPTNLSPVSSNRSMHDGKDLLPHIDSPHSDESSKSRKIDPKLDVTDPAGSPIGLRSPESMSRSLATADDTQSLGSSINNASHAVIKHEEALSPSANLLSTSKSLSPCSLPPAGQSPRSSSTPIIMPFSKLDDNQVLKASSLPSPTTLHARDCRLKLDSDTPLVPTAVAKSPSDQTSKIRPPPLENPLSSLQKLVDTTNQPTVMANRQRESPQPTLQHKSSSATVSSLDGSSSRHSSCSPPHAGLSPQGETQLKPTSVNRSSGLVPALSALYAYVEKSGKQTVERSPTTSSPSISHGGGGDFKGFEAAALYAAHILSSTHSSGQPAINQQPTIPADVGPEQLLKQLLANLMPDASNPSAHLDNWMALMAQAGERRSSQQAEFNDSQSNAGKRQRVEGLDSSTGNTVGQPSTSVASSPSYSAAASKSIGLNYFVPPQGPLRHSAPVSGVGNNYFPTGPRPAYHPSTGSLPAANNMITKKAKCHYCGKPFANKGQVRLHVSKNKCPCLLQQTCQVSTLSGGMFGPHNNNNAAANANNTGGSRIPPLPMPPGTGVPPGSNLAKNGSPGLRPADGNHNASSALGLLKQRFQNFPDLLSPPASSAPTTSHGAIFTPPIDTAASNHAGSAASPNSTQLAAMALLAQTLAQLTNSGSGRPEEHKPPPTFWTPPQNASDQPTSQSAFETARALAMFNSTPGRPSDDVTVCHPPPLSAMPPLSTDLVKNLASIMAWAGGQQTNGSNDPTNYSLPPTNLSTNHGRPST